MGRIVCNPEILGGKPVIKGTRIAAYLILDLLAEEYSIEEINGFYTHINAEDIKACIKYAAKLCQSGETVEPFGVTGDA